MNACAGANREGLPLRLRRRGARELPRQVRGCSSAIRGVRSTKAQRALACGACSSIPSHAMTSATLTGCARSARRATVRHPDVLSSECDEVALFGDAVGTRVVERARIDGDIERDDDLAAQGAEQVDHVGVAARALAFEGLAAEHAGHADGEQEREVEQAILDASGQLVGELPQEIASAE